jgi:hypothetical protein
MSEDTGQIRTRRRLVVATLASLLAVVLLLCGSCSQRRRALRRASRVRTEKAEKHLAGGRIEDAFFELERAPLRQDPAYAAQVQAARGLLQQAVWSACQAPGAKGTAAPPASRLAEATRAAGAAAGSPALSPAQTAKIAADYQRVVDSIRRGKSVATTATELGLSRLYTEVLLGCQPP